MRLLLTYSLGLAAYLSADMCVPSVGPEAVVWSDRTGGDDPHNCAAPIEQHRYTFPSSVDGAPDGVRGPLLGGSYHYLRSNIDPCTNDTENSNDSGSGDVFNGAIDQCPNRGGFVGVADAAVEGMCPPHVEICIESFQECNTRLYIHTTS